MQGYLDTIKSKTGKSVEDLRKLAAKKGLTTRAEIVKWAQSELGLGLGHARAVAHVLLRHEAGSVQEQIDAHFAGGKSEWRSTYETLLTRISKFGKDIQVSPAKAYLSLVRNEKKFAVLQPATRDRFDIGLKLKGMKPAGRLEAAGSWNSLVTHRVKITDQKQIDAEVLRWLKQAYDNASK